MSNTKRHSGVIVPMVTPFTAKGDIDVGAAARITRFLVENGSAPFIMGTTGESASIPDAQRPEYVKAVIAAASGKTLVYAGVSDNCLQSSIDTAKQYADLGIDAVAAHLPSYYSLTPGQMLRYYETLAEKVPVPLILYNITITVHMSIPLDVIDKLSHHPNIVGLKDSERDLLRFEKAIEMWKDREDFSHLIGWGAQILHGLKLGSDGMVPSTANIIPGVYRQLYEALRKGDLDTAKQLQTETDRVSQIYQKGRTLGQSLAALKVIMNAMKLCQPYLLPPLNRLPSEEEALLRRETESLLLPTEVL